MVNLWEENQTGCGGMKRTFVFTIYIIKTEKKDWEVGNVVVEDYTENHWIVFSANGESVIGESVLFYSIWIWDDVCGLKHIHSHKIIVLSLVIMNIKNKR